MPRPYTPLISEPPISAHMRYLEGTVPETAEPRYVAPMCWCVHSGVRVFAARGSLEERSRASIRCCNVSAERQQRQAEIGLTRRTSTDQPPAHIGTNGRGRIGSLGDGSLVSW